MLFMQWTDSLRIGIEEIDNQHKKLIGMINTFHDHLPKDNVTAIKELLGSMASYTVYHFNTEETYFEQFNYPQTDTHKKEHEKFIAEVYSVQARLEGGSPLLALELSGFLKKWLIDHIMVSDKKYAPFLVDKGLK